MIQRFLLLALCLIFPSCTATTGEFGIPREEFLRDVKRIKALPLFASVFPEVDAAPIEARVHEQLKAFGYEVVTGEQPEDATLSAMLVPRKAEILGSQARWDGVSRTAIPLGGIFGRNEDIEGTCGGVSLSVMITTEGKRLYTGSGGIALLHRWEKMRFVDVPLEEVFGNPSHVDEGIQKALGSLRRQ